MTHPWMRERRLSGYSRAVTSPDTPRGRHRLAVPAAHPALLPRSATVVAVTVGVVLSLGLPGRAQVPAARPHPDAPAPALQPVIPAPRDDRAASPVPAGVTGSAIAGAHATGYAAVRALDAAAALQPPHAVAPESLFAA